jgi:hypothetical protein
MFAARSRRGFGFGELIAPRFFAVFSFFPFLAHGAIYIFSSEKKGIIPKNEKKIA